MPAVRRARTTRATVRGLAGRVAGAMSTAASRALGYWPCRCTPTSWRRRPHARSSSSRAHADIGHSIDPIDTIVILVSVRNAEVPASAAGGRAIAQVARDTATDPSYPMRAAVAHRPDRRQCASPGVRRVADRSIGRTRRHRSCRSARVTQTLRVEAELVARKRVECGAPRGASSSLQALDRPVVSRQAPAVTPAGAREGERDGR